MEKKKLFTLIGIGAAAIILIVVLIVVIFFRKEFPYNPPGTVGNTAGNLYNAGLYARLDDKIFFANSFDGYALYSMNIDETDVKKVSNVVVQNLLAAGDFVYFFQNGTNGSGGFENVTNNRGFSRYSISEGLIENLSKDIVVYNQLVDNDLYMLSTSKTGYRFFKMKIDSKEETELGNSVINPACARNGVIYYAGVDMDHALHSIDITEDVSRIALQKNLWFPILDGEWLYYLDLDTNYHLCRYSMLTQETEELTSERVDSYNVGNGYIYYQKNSSTSPQLKCMRTDGTEVMIVAEGNYMNINMSPRYVYFQEFGKEFTTYHCLIGSNGYGIFYGGQDAAISNLRE